MKYIVTIVALTLSIFTTNVMAGTTATINGTVVSSTAIMEDVIRNMPQDTCRVVEVPVYGNTKGSAGDAIAGAIIGGVLGNQVGKGSGKDAATIFGKRVIVGYKQVEQCDRTYVKVRESVVVGYETQVQLYDDLVHSFQTTRQYTVGSTVPVRMTLSLN
jgi:uncharacterized protein YcfJ